MRELICSTLNGSSVGDMYIYRAAVGVVGPLLWFPLFPDNDDESPLQA